MNFFRMEKKLENKKELCKNIYSDIMNLNIKFNYYLFIYFFIHNH